MDQSAGPFAPAERCSAHGNFDFDPNPSGERRGLLHYDANRKRWDYRIVIDGKRRKLSGRTKAEALDRAKALPAAPAVVTGLPPRSGVAEWLDH